MMGTSQTLDLSLDLDQDQEEGKSKGSLPTSPRRRTRTTLYLLAKLPPRLVLMRNRLRYRTKPLCRRPPTPTTLPDTSPTQSFLLSLKASLGPRS